MALVKPAPSLALASYGLVILVTLNLVNGFQQSRATHNQLQQQQQQSRTPVIYTIQSEQANHNHQQQQQSPASAASISRKSWDNRRLAKQILQEPESSANDSPISSYHTDEISDSSASSLNQFGDLSLLYSHQTRSPIRSVAGATKASSSSSSNRWPAHHSRQGTKSGQATKGIGKRRPTSSTNRAHGRAQPESPPRPHVHLSPPVEDDKASSSDKQNSSSNGTSTTRANSKRKNLVCYYGTWAVYRPDAGKYPVENIDPFLCTHIVYGFTGLSYDNTIKPLDPWNDLEDNYGKGAMKRFTNLKRVNPDLKTLVAIGGWNEGSIKYSKMASEPEARAKFVDSVVNFLIKYNFDGLDLDWEYPAARGGASYDKQNLVKLMRELKDAFAPHGFLLTAAVSAGKWFVDPAYDIPQVGKYLDLINLMAYDYHGGWETKTGHNAPLFHSAKHDLTREEQMLNVNWSVNYWLQMGAPREKLMLGVGSYGRSFTLDKSQVNGINAPASQKGQAGPYTREPGSLGYNEICEFFQRQPNAWTIVRDPDYLAPYAYNDRQWVGYDDQESLALKAQYAKSMGLGGMMMWSVETDDFQGRCHGEKYPLLNTIRRVLDSTAGGSGLPKPPGSRPTTTTRRPEVVVVVASTSRPAVTPTTPGREVEDDNVPSSTVSYPTSSTTRKPRPHPPATSRRPIGGSGSRPSTTTRRPPTSTTTTTTTTTTRRPPTGSNQEFACRSDGMFADPRNCRKFIRCVNSGADYIAYKFDCAPGTAFNELQQYCDYIHNVPSCQRSGADAVAVGEPNANEITNYADDDAEEKRRRKLELEEQTERRKQQEQLQQSRQLIRWEQLHQRPIYPDYFAHRFVVHHQWR